MLSNAKLVAFAATASPDTARAFYANTLNLELIEDSPFALVFNANGTTLRVQKTESVTVVPYTVLGWEVDCIATVVNDLASRGVQFERFDGLPQNEQGVWATPGGAQVAWFKDPDGNTLSVTQTSS